jgi:hypothetical protein
LGVLFRVDHALARCLRFAHLLPAFRQGLQFSPCVGSPPTAQINVFSDFEQQPVDGLKAVPTPSFSD